MQKVFTRSLALVVATALVGLAACAKKEEGISPNTLQLTAQGKQSRQLTFPTSAVTVTLSNNKTVCVLTAKVADANFNIELVSGGSSLEIPHTYNATQTGAPSVSSQYGYQVVTDFSTYCGTPIYKNDYITYQTYSTNMPVCTVVINAVNPDQHIMSGTFSGTYWKGCDKVEIVDGQFRLPYTINP